MAGSGLGEADVELSRGIPTNWKYSSCPAGEQMQSSFMVFPEFPRLSYASICLLGRIMRMYSMNHADEHCEESKTSVIPLLAYLIRDHPPPTWEKHFVSRFQETLIHQ
jgi:hypothetical protein